jgi:hypothetical protein
MRSFQRVALLVCLLVLSAPFSVAADFEPDLDGPWINVDVINLVEYGNTAYYEYLGQGYIAMLDALKSEGLILDYGVLEKTTGKTNEGDVVIWWSIESLADYEKALKRMETLASELWTAGELAELWPKLEKVREIKSSNLYRAVLWNKVEE